jgi:hypothetical protein
MLEMKAIRRPRMGPAAAPALISALARSGGSKIQRLKDLGALKVSKPAQMAANDVHA